QDGWGLLVLLRSSNPPPGVMQRALWLAPSRSRPKVLFLLAGLILALFRFGPGLEAASYYTQRLADARAVYLPGPSGGDDTAALQKSIDQVQSTNGLGIVFL